MSSSKCVSCLLWVSSYVAWAWLVTEMEQQERHSSHIRITAEKVTHTPLVAAMWQHRWKDHNWTWERTETEANRKQEWQRRIELQIRETAKAKSKDYRGQWVSRYSLPPGTERVHNSCLAMKPEGLDAHGSEMITSAGLAATHHLSAEKFTAVECQAAANWTQSL